MRLFTCLISYLIYQLGFSQVYEDHGPFHGGDLTLSGSTYSFIEYFCTGNNYSQGTFYQSGDTLFLNSVDSFDRGEKYGNWFIKMEDEPFLMKGNTIYPIGKAIESYLFMEKKE